MCIVQKLPVLLSGLLTLACFWIILITSSQSRMSPRGFRGRQNDR